MKTVKVAVMAVNAFGVPSLPTYQVECTDEEVCNGTHYEKAIDLAEADGYDTFKAFDANDGAARQLLATAAFFEKLPKVVVMIEDGRVQDVISDVEISYGTVNYDTDGAEEDDIFYVPRSDGSPDAAVRNMGLATCNAELVDLLFELIGPEDSLYGVPPEDLYQMCSAVGIRLVEATEEEIWGYWDWIRGNVACERSLETKHLAAVDALGALFPIEAWKELGSPGSSYARWVKTECQSATEAVET